MTDHDRYRELVGAYVLGALDATERADLEAHLPTCRRCRDEVVELAPLPGLLAQVHLEDLDSTTRPPTDAVVAGARLHLDRMRRSRRRWRIGAGAAAAIATLALGAGFVADRAAPDRDGAESVALVVDAEPSVTGSVVADERAWGTYVHVSLAGLPPRDRYRIWAVDTSGGWHEAGSWSPTEDGMARLGASTHLRLDEIERVVVTSQDRSDPVATARPG